MQEHKNLQEFRGADAKAIANLGFRDRRTCLKIPSPRLAPDYSRHVEAQRPPQVRKQLFATNCDQIESSNSPCCSPQGKSSISRL